MTLNRAVHAFTALAVVWHVVLAIAVLMIAKRWWMPSSRTVALSVASVLASVSLSAWLSGNAFNGAVLAVAWVALSAIALHVHALPRDFTPPWARQVGLLLVAFGWLYPEFLQERTVWYYLVAAPLGVLPCPSLAAVLGLGLWYGLFGSRAWGLTAAGFALAYGTVGALYLGVQLDLVLVVGALVTLFASVGLRPLKVGAIQHGSLTSSSAPPARDTGRPERPFRRPSP